MNKLHEVTRQVTGVLSSWEKSASKMLDIPFKQPELKDSKWLDNDYKPSEKRLAFWSKVLGTHKEVKPFDERFAGFLTYIILEKIVLGAVLLASYCLFWR